MLGAWAGSKISFNTKGLDFVLTALFVVIFIGQWKNKENRKPAIIGILCSIMCLIVFGQDSFIIPSMAVILIALTIQRKEYTENKNLTEEGIQ